jgi:hypothetical protein
MNIAAQPLPERPPTSELAKWTLLALVAAVMPVVFALVLLGSVARRRPLLGRRGARTVARTQTITWGVGLLIIGLLQGASAVLVGTSVTDPADFLIRTLASLALEGAIYVGISAFLRRR